VKKLHPRKTSFIAFIVLVCIVVALDRITKLVAVNALSGGVVKPFIPGFIDFRLVFNTGAAWGLFSGARVMFLVVAAVAVAAMLVYLLVASKHSKFEILGLGFIAGGAIGNAFDRAQSGEVVDFIHTLFIDFPYFNIADSAITIGVIVLLIAILFSNNKSQQND
jgi:signal peptidase II